MKLIRNNFLLSKLKNNIYIYICIKKKRNILYIYLICKNKDFDSFILSIFVKYFK